MRPVTCLVTYEEYPTETEVIYSPKCYCILTSHPTGDFARKWLQAFNRELKGMNAGAREAAISELLALTYNNSPGTVLNIGTQKLQEKIMMPFKGGLPACHNNAFWLINSIGLGNVVNIILWLLQEEKVLFVSSNLPILSQCIETIGSLLYPFSWSFLYVTVLPIPLIDYTQSPMPFIIGFLRSAFMSIKRKEIPEGAMIVDLDYGTVMGANTLTNVPPPYLVKQLFSDLRCANDVALGMDDPLNWNSWDGINSQRLRTSNLIIRGAFLRFFASLLRDHRRYIQFLRLLPKPHVHFSPSVFVQSFDEDSRTFVDDMITKQMFLAFIENRPWPLGDSFDAAIDAKIWNIPMEELPNYMQALVDGTAHKPVFGLSSEDQMIHDEGVTKETKDAYDKAIATGIPSIVNFRADSLDFLKKSISEQYFRIQFCTQLREYLHSQDRRAWEVSENAWRLIGDFLGFMITESEAKNDFVSLKLIAAILHKCFYTKGIETHYLCERSGFSPIWKEPTTWEEIFCLIMTSTLQKLYTDVKIDEKWNELPEGVVKEYADKEWGETRLEFAFLVSIMESLDVPPIVMKKLMPVVIVNFDETKYQELIELLEPSTMAKLKEVESMTEHPLPQNLVNANAVVCWVDDKINEPTLLMNVKFVKDEAQRTKKNFVLEIQSKYNKHLFLKYIPIMCSFFMLCAF